MSSGNAVGRRPAFAAGLTAALLLARPVPAGDGRPSLEEYLRVRPAAEAASADRRWEAAAPLWEKVVAADPVDGRSWARLAAARYHLKDYRNAIPAHERALELGAGYPSDAAYNIACCYALLGERPRALEWLERAFAMGFRSPADAQSDGDLRSLHDDERFRALVALADTGKMTREEGWRYDIQFLAREVRRKGYDPFRKVSRERFDESIRRLSDAAPRLSDGQIIVELMKIMRNVGDGHSSVLGSRERTDVRPALPVQFYLFREGLYVIAADPKYKDLLGAEVVRFGDRSVDEVLRALDPLLSRDNEMWPKQVAPYRMRSVPLLHALGLVPDPNSVRLTVRDAGGKSRPVRVEADSAHPDIWNTLPHPPEWVGYPQTLAAPVPLYLNNQRASHWFEHLPEHKLVYFQYNRVRDDPGESLGAFSERLFKFIESHDVERLVIDMRWNNGGNTLLNEPLLLGLIRCAKVNRPGGVFVIIGRRTFSAAQNAAVYFERFVKPVFVGEPTGGKPNSVGEEPIFTLPYSKLLVNVSTLYWASSWPSDYRPWIAPHLYCPPTFAAFRANRDPCMEAVLAYVAAEAKKPAPRP